ncbi:hypothetical protein GPJ56_001089 [Histomonas meleagridis]|uniref:uncharacterized protein n=1 Tax=Histomonas meleagridis TaxID=135588 RepID=UPI00355A0FBC|nr:hypothetical protein GPJ56_001089 [Histomonas meleagridis]KAH0798449.1 hypothetical protein GO595_008719 [Histomonas meleagridis]
MGAEESSNSGFEDQYSAPSLLGLSDNIFDIFGVNDKTIDMIYNDKKFMNLDFGRSKNVEPIFEKDDNPDVRKRKAEVMERKVFKDMENGKATYGDLLAIGEIVNAEKQKARDTNFWFK